MNLATFIVLMSVSLSTFASPSDEDMEYCDTRAALVTAGFIATSKGESRHSIMKEISTHITAGKDIQDIVRGDVELGISLYAMSPNSSSDTIYDNVYAECIESIAKSKPQTIDNLDSELTIPSIKEPTSIFRPDFYGDDR